MTPFRLIAMALPALILTACSSRDAASEAPIDLKPGNYDVWVRGPGTFITAPEGKARVQLCLSEFDAREWPSHPLEKTTRRYNGCYDQIDQPRGNALSGKRTCRVGTGTFTGDHTDERFTIRGTVKSSTSDKTEDFTITGRRSGDC